MPNPRFLQTAERWKNKEIPTEREKKQRPIKQKTPFATGNVNYSFLEGNSGKQILEEYNQRVKADYKDSSALKVLSFADNVVQGSNPFAFVLLNKILTQQKMRIATPADLERALEKEAINLRDTYGDSGLVLRGGGEPNQYLARDLINQVKQKGSLQYPLMIPLEGLDLKYDSNSPHNLSFQLTDFSELIYASQLNKINQSKKFNRADEQGLPIFEDNGSRTLYSNEDGGLCRLCRGGVLGLVAGDWYLASSGDYGRVIVCAEGTRAKN